MRYFFSAGEPSGELAATLLAGAIARLDAGARFEGIGATKMRESGFSLLCDSSGWASVGRAAAIPKIPKLGTIALKSAVYLRRTMPDLVVLVNFGAFNLRLARLLRALGYRKPILDLFPPATWLDDARTARHVASLCTPLTAFAHQRDFYASLHLPIAYFGHPLTGQYAMRARRAAPAVDSGTVALLPGSRDAELRKHLPVILAAYKLLQKDRPGLRGTAGAANERTEAIMSTSIGREGVQNITVVRGAASAIAEADAAWVASGTAVLECALAGVPVVALYIADATLARRARKSYKGRFVTLPNLVLEQPVVPEFLQERATPAALARAMDAALREPEKQFDRFAELREKLGPPNALERCAAFAVTLAKSGES